MLGKLLQGPLTLLDFAEVTREREAAVQPH